MGCRAYVVLVVVCTCLGAMDSLMGWTVAPAGDPDAGRPTQQALALPPSAPWGALMALEGPFVENLGQVDDPQVRFCAHGDPLSVALTPDGAAFALRQAGGGRTAVFRLYVAGGRPVEPVGEGAPSHPTSFFLGDDPGRWVRSARGFGAVRYEDVLDGVDLRFLFRDGMLKYELLLDGDVDPAGVLMRYDGLEALSVDIATGELLLATGAGVLRDSRPVVLQEGLAQGLGAAFRVLGDGTVGFELPPGVADGRALVIDPGLRWSTYLGGVSSDWSSALILDGDGNTIVSGPTNSFDFPTTPGVYDRTGNLTSWWDIFVTAMSPDGSSVVWSTFIGGTGGEESVHMVRDATGDILVVGETGSYNFPTTADAIDTTPNGRTDSFLLKLKDGGSDLLYSTYLGGSSFERARGVALDADGNVLVAGYTWSSNFPASPGAFCTTHAGGSEAFVLKVGSDLGSLSWCTFLGGRGEDNATDVTVDGVGNAYVCGYTGSDGFPTTPGAYMPRKLAGWYNAFVTCLSPSGDALVASTFLGGSGPSHGYGLMLAQNGSVVLTGQTGADDFPKTPGAICATRRGEYDCFVSMLDGALSGLQYSTLLGGGDSDAGAAVAWGRDRGSILVLGATRSADLPTTVGAYDREHRGESDGFVIAINLTGMSLGYCTYFGGASYDGVAYGGFASDADGTARFTGATWSTDFPTTEDAFCRTYGGGWVDSYLVSIDPVACAVPGAPAGVVAEGGDTCVTLSWEAPAFGGCRLLAHRVFRSTTPGAEEPLAELAPNATAYVDVGLTNGVRYYYRVSAVNTAGEGPRSTMVNAVPIGLPSAPLDLSATTANGTVTLAWSPPASAGGGQVLGYTVLRGTDALGLAAVATLANVTQHLDVDVAKGTLYYYAVRAFNERGEGPASALATVVPMSPASPPVAFCATAGYAEVRLSWGLPLDDGGTRLLGFNVHRGPGPGGLVIVATLLPNERSFVDTDVVNGEAYWYAVSAFSSFAEGELTQAIPAVPYGVPGPPSGLTAVAGDGQVFLEWSPPLSDGGLPLTGYAIHVEMRSRTLTIKVGNVTEHMHLDLTNGVLHTYRVAAVNEVGEGPMGEAVEATPMGLPGPPTGLTAQATVDGVRLAWGTPDSTGGAASVSYTVRRGLAPDALIPLALGLTTNEHLDEDVEPGQRYYYAVMAVNTVGEGLPSNVVEARAPRAPGPVGALVADWGDGNVTLTWTAPEDDGGLPVVGFVVLRGTDAATLTDLTTLGLVLEHTDAGLQNGVTLFYAVSAINALGTGDRSLVVNATPLGKPGAVATLVAKAEDGRIVVTWTPPVGVGSAPITGYIILRGDSADDLVPIATLGTVLSYTDGTAKSGRTYHYSVIATSEVGDGTVAPPSKATLKAKEPGPSAAAALVAVAVTACALGARGRTRRPGR